MPVGEARSWCQCSVRVDAERIVLVTPLVRGCARLVFSCGSVAGCRDCVEWPFDPRTCGADLGFQGILRSGCARLGARWRIFVEFLRLCSV